MTVDEILASRFYLDRTGHGWNAVTFWASATGLDTVQKWVGRLGALSQDQMRLLIERDRHRDECPGLADCMTHPVPAVIVCYEHGEGWGLFKVGVRAQSLPTIRRTLPEAMDAARVLAVGE